MTFADIETAIANARQGFALITFEAACYTPEKIDFDMTEASAKAHGIDHDDVKVTKRTVIDGRLELAKKILGQARRYHYRKTRPWAGRRVGIVRGQDLLDYAKTMESYKKQFKAVVEEMALEWPGIVAEQADRLGPVFKAEDYPTTNEFSGKFNLKYYVNELPSEPDWLLDVPREAVEEIAGSFESQMAERMEDMRSAVAAEAVEVFRKSLRVLRKGDPRGIRRSLVANIQEQQRWLKDLNIGDDQTINKLVSEIEQAIVAVGADDLRDDDAKRNAAAKALASSITTIQGGAR